MGKVEDETTQLTNEELQEALKKAEEEKEKAVQEALKQAEAEKEKAVQEALQKAASEQNTKKAGKTGKVKMVPIKIEKDKEHRDDVLVCVNGKNFQIKRGEMVEVPEYVVEVLENMKKMDELAIERMEAATKQFA